MQPENASDIQALTSLSSACMQCIRSDPNQLYHKIHFSLFVLLLCIWYLPKLACLTLGFSASWIFFPTRTSLNLCLIPMQTPCKPKKHCGIWKERKNLFEIISAFSSLFCSNNGSALTSKGAHINSKLVNRISYWFIKHWQWRMFDCFQCSKVFSIVARLYDYCDHSISKILHCFVLVFQWF